jgi:hypothetical protein
MHYKLTFLVRMLVIVALAILPALVIGQNCQLVVPPQPLTANGLATPYLLQYNATSIGNCLANNVNFMAFVHGVILDTKTGDMSVYNPLVINAGGTAAIQPIAPTLPAQSIVALWFGFNGNILTLVNYPGVNSTGQGLCVNGAYVNGALDTFVEFAYCNAPAFYNAARNLILAGKITVPPLGNASDGQTCPNVRSWDVVDSDQSDGVPVFYLVDGVSQNVAQYSADNMAKLTNPQVAGNVGDNILVTNFIMPAVGCSGSIWKVPDLANNGNPTSALPLNEIQAMVYASYPQALVPLNNDFVVVGAGGDPNPTLPTTLFPAKVNLYRQGVFQPKMADFTGTPLTTMGQITGQASPKAYCYNLNTKGGPDLTEQTMTLT